MNKINEIINETKRIQFYYQNQSRKFAKNKLLEKGYQMKNIKKAFRKLRASHRAEFIRKMAIVLSITILSFLIFI